MIPCANHPSQLQPCPTCNGVDTYIAKPAAKVTGSDNPHYDFERSVQSLQELVDVLDPNMDYRRYNILKAVIRWDKKPDLEYNLAKIRYFGGHRG